MQEGEDQWPIACRDGARRTRELRVFVTASADIALQAPPGEVAVITPNQVADVKATLTHAQIRAVAKRQAL
jgi:hypothetical protein